jgi:hypothetical protein
VALNLRTMEIESFAADDDVALRHCVLPPDFGRVNSAQPVGSQ